MALRRGFKAEAAALAQEIRVELGLGPIAALVPSELAQHLDIPVITLGELSTTLPNARHFLSVERNAFSALTVFDGHRRMIVHNDSHSRARQNSNLAHELAHAPTASRARASSRQPNGLSALERQKRTGSRLAQWRITRDQRHGPRSSSGANYGTRSSATLRGK